MSAAITMRNTHIKMSWTADTHTYNSIQHEYIPASSLDKWIAGLCSNATLVGLVTGHQDVTVVSPASTPTEI